MGMFDDVKCRYALPKSVDTPNDLDYQTKSLDCNLDRYEITEEGFLLREGQPTNYRGEIRFYDLLGDPNSPVGPGWVEYSALFNDGRLVGDIRLITYRPDPAAK